MNEVETILVVLLSVGFFTLLVLAIILVSMMIAIMRNVRRISKRAEEATSSMAEVASLIGSKVAPVAISTVVAALVRKFKSKKE